MSRVDDLMARSQLLIEIPKQVSLRFSVECQTRLVKQQNQFASGLLDLGELDEEREEPNKASTSFRERQRKLMKIVLHACPSNDALVKRHRVASFRFRYAYFKFNVWVLRPIL